MPVPWLSYAANIDQDFFRFQGVLVIQIRGSMELHLFREYPWDMRVPLEAVLPNQGKYFFHLGGVVNIFGKDVFVQRIAGRTMHVHDAVVPMDPGKFGEEIPSFQGRSRIAGAGFQLLTCPEDGFLGSTAETFRVKQGGLVMVAQDAGIKCQCVINALQGIGAISNDVAKTVDR